MESIILRGEVLAVCPDGDDVIVATKAALYRVTRRGHIEPLGPLDTTYTLDLAVTSTPRPRRPTKISWCPDASTISKMATVESRRGRRRYEATKEGLIRVTVPSFWDWVLGRC